MRPRNVTGCCSCKAYNKNIAFQHCFYLGNPEHDEAILRVALQDEAGNLQGVQGARIHAKYLLDYRADLGYRVRKD